MSSIGKTDQKLPVKVSWKGLFCDSIVLRAIVCAEKACECSAQSVEDHFSHVSDMIEIGKGHVVRSKTSISRAMFIPLLYLFFHVNKSARYCIMKVYRS